MNSKEWKKWLFWFSFAVASIAVYKTVDSVSVIFNELKIRGYRVDVGVVEITETNAEGKRVQKGLEIDFIATKGNNKYYIQSAFDMPDLAKEQQEKKSLIKTKDSFKKIIVVKDDIKLKRDDNGITTMGIFDFLLNENSLDM